MSRRTDDRLRLQAHQWAKKNIPKAEIGRRIGVSATTVSRILAEPPPKQSPPFSGGPYDEANPPENQYNNDQPKPPPIPPRFRPGYHDHTFRAPSGLVGFEGWDVDRVRNAIATHDQGFFYESSLLYWVCLRFGPVFAALSQAIAPALALPRHVRGGTKGLSRILREEVEQQLAPRAGLLPSPYFPPTVWGAAAIDLRMMGFAVLQHVYGEPDPDTGVRPVFTRRWPTWAVQYYRYRLTYQAITTEGPVDIISGDGKFTLLADSDEPHFQGAIRALALETLDGCLAKQARASYIERYGNPKWIGIMPEEVGTYTPEGDAMFQAMEQIQGPDGFGTIPHGADFKVEQISASSNSVFTSALDNVWRFIAAILLGSDGTMSPSTGVYSAPIFAGVRRDLVDRMLKSMVRGINMGHVAPWLEYNYASSIAEARGWVQPVLDIPLPDPAADQRIDSYANRMLKLHEILQKEKDSGCIITQDRVNQLAEELEVATPTLSVVSSDATFTLTDSAMALVVRGREGRENAGLPPFGDERDEKTLNELEQDAKAKAEAKKAEAEAQADADADVEVAEAEAEIEEGAEETSEDSAIGAPDAPTEEPAQPEQEPPSDEEQTA